jgi:hypothetical protein
VVVFSPEGFPEGPRVEGVGAWRAQAQRLRDTWQEARCVIEELTEVAPGTVFARFRYVTSGGQGIGFDTEMAGAFVFEGGKVKRVQYTWDPAEALRIARGESG